MTSTVDVVFLGLDGLPLPDQTKPIEDMNGDYVIDPRKPYYGKMVAGENGTLLDDVSMMALCSKCGENTVKKSDIIGE